MISLNLGGINGRAVIARHMAYGTAIKLLISKVWTTALNSTMMLLIGQLVYQHLKRVVLALQNPVHTWRIFQGKICQVDFFFSCLLCCLSIFLAFYLHV